jgi:hypothetical protein
MSFLRSILALATCFVIASCAREDLSKPPPPVGDFRLAYNIVVADNVEPVGPSRQATADEWEIVLKDEIQKRVGRYEGEKLYHLGISVDAYALALPGIPLVFKPRSILSIRTNVWDDTAQRRINAEPKRITVFEPFSANTFIGSGITQNRDAQMRNLAAKAAREINEWLVENKAWFTAEAVEARRVLGKQADAPTSETSAAAATSN